MLWQRRHERPRVVEKTIARVLELSRPSTKYSDAEFDRFFRRVYQHFISARLRTPH